MLHGLSCCMGFTSNPWAHHAAWAELLHGVHINPLNPCCMRYTLLGLTGGLMPQVQRLMSDCNIAPVSWRYWHISRGQTFSEGPHTCMHHVYGMHASCLWHACITQLQTSWAWTAYTNRSDSISINAWGYIKYIGWFQDGLVSREVTGRRGFAPTPPTFPCSVPLRSHYFPYPREGPRPSYWSTLMPHLAWCKRLFLNPFGARGPHLS